MKSIGISQVHECIKPKEIEKKKGEREHEKNG